MQLAAQAVTVVGLSEKPPSDYTVVQKSKLYTLVDFTK